ncbi:MAG: TetR/AcrR family transcriptional regulator [Rhodocyclaceae bacterium]|nr:TetR/AcrR family transcriptional regulator [Rhodocyclaceae bacterium]MDP2196386.1 TetR/AcrR family transcriptional regulator [Rhodocyclaceae bacterium]
MDKSSPEKPPTAREALDRAAWIAAALDIVAQDGIDGLRVEGLAKRLGVTKGSFYWHFKDRRDLIDAVLDDWRAGRIRDIRKQTAAAPGNEETALRHTIEVYAAAKNRKGISIEASIRLWARQDANGLAVVEEVDAERLECTRRLFLARNLPPAEAAARSALLYAYVFGFSMMQCGRFAMDAAQTKRWIVEQIIK